jgi:hypothetical protein
MEDLEVILTTFRLPVHLGLAKLEAEGRSKRDTDTLDGNPT